MKHTEHTLGMLAAYCAGGRADQEFTRACRKAGIAPGDALIGSPLLNLHIAQHKFDAEHARYLRDKAVRAA